MMIEKIILIALMTLFISCGRGIWISQHAYRPKHPRFSIQNIDFVANPLINSNYLYVSQTKYISDSQERKMLDFTGLYPDGRMIGTSLNDLQINRIYEMNSWETAASIGHYRTVGNRIFLEYFIPGEGGQYVKKEGIIKQDTLIFFETGRLLAKKATRSDTLLKSSFPLK